MLFSSPAFFVFFAIYFLCHLFFGKRYRNYLIIAGSTIFYAWWRVEYVWVPYLLAAVAIGGVKWLEAAKAEGQRKFRLILAITGLFLPLAIFKYTDFIYGKVLGPVFDWNGKLLGLPLPLGISFVTFTLTAYLVDTYKRKFSSNHRISTILAYVLFFPHLIAGPILRPVELIPQLELPRPATFRRFVIPLAVFTVGLVKKLVFADQIASYVDAVYNSSGAVTSAPSALLAIYGFSVQIYCDFSGYTDMAIGLALFLGVRLPTNFRRPYCSGSIIEFWRRWHITLSYWLRDYLYIPLGGNRGGTLNEFRNILITMALGGLWHGASWTFVAWGALHGVGVSFVHGVKRFLGWRLSWPRWLSIFLTFHFVTLAWICFRASNMGKALEVLSAAFTGSWGDTSAFLSLHIFPLMLMAVFAISHPFDDVRLVRIWVRRIRPEILWPLIVILWIAAITVSVGSSAKFIYFEF